MRLAVFAWLCLSAGLAWEGSVSKPDSPAWALLKRADVVILGELHDNPDHHAVQAELTGKLNPGALVFEMLTEEQAARITPELREDQRNLEEVLGWEASGWPDFEMYYPIMEAAPDAKIYGAAVPRAVARAAIANGVAATFGPEADAYGLTMPLPETEQAEREALQMAAHCDALPVDMLPGMVDVQRLRDAALARSTVQALTVTGGPVLVITGNGHAREDWGMPVYLRRVRPEIELVTLGQGEDDRSPEGVFDIVLSAPAAEREDPCAAFK